MPDKRIRRLVTRIQALANEHSTYLSVQQVADTVGQASLALFNSLIEPKQPVKAGRTFGPGFNRAVDTRLAPFKKRVTLPVVGGVLTLPERCAYVTAYAVPGAVQVQEVDDHALALRLDCPLTGPTAKNPIVATVDEGQKQFYPVSVASCTVTCYLTPPTPVYGLTDESDENSYDDAQSVDTGWGEEAEPELISRTLTLLGIPLRDPALQQAGITHTTQDV
jgi:hypothetical protein